jgi:hypothetical protein
VGDKPEQFVVRLHKGQPWTGCVHDSADKPVAKANIVWIGPGHRAFVRNGRLQPRYEGSPEWVVKTDADGHFELPPSRTEGWILALHDTGYGCWYSRGIVRDSTVHLTAWAQVEGTIRIADSNDHSVRIRMEPVDEGTQARTLPIRWLFDETSHVDGRFLFKYVPSIPLTIGHVSEEISGLASHVTPQPGQTSNVEIEAVRAKPVSTASLVGNTLPKLENIGIKFDLEQAANRIILLCFSDIGQRPSRNCLRQLSARAQKLQAQDVIVLAVQATKVGKYTLNEWVRKNSITFPIGVVQRHEEKTRASWGVRSLPWLILTDKNHIVCSSGFSVTELDNRIQSAQE